METPIRETGLALILILLGLVPVPAREILVRQDKRGEFQDIQAAIDAAEPGDTVVVGRGTYEILRSIEFDPTRRLWNGTCPTPTSRNLRLCSEEGPEVTTIRMADAPESADRSTVLIFDSGESSESLVEGFTIVGGGRTDWGNDSRLKGGGGALCLCDSSPVFRNCIFRGNGRLITDRGAGLMFAKGASPAIIQCRFEDNIAQCDGGAIHGADNSRALIEDCVFSGNLALQDGGAIILEQYANATIRNCRFERNYAEFGAALVCRGATPLIENCVMVGNRARACAGALFCHARKEPPKPDAVARLVRCTVVGNSALVGGAFYQQIELGVTGRIVLEECIVWGNAGGTFSEYTANAPADTFVADYSCLELPQDRLAELGEGNLNDDPRLGAWGQVTDVWVDERARLPADGTVEHPFGELKDGISDFDCRLAPDSPCLQAGAAGGPVGVPLPPCEHAGATLRTVHLQPGRYSIRGFSLAHGVSLEGAGRGETTVEGTVFGLRAGARLSRLTITRGFSGGALVGTGEDVEFTDVDIVGNRVAHCIQRLHLEDWGGGVVCVAASPTFRRCRIEGNWGGRGGGLCIRGGSPRLLNCVISGNLADNYGGGICCLDGASPLLLNCTLAGNVAGRQFDGISVAESTLHLRNCIVLGNDDLDLETALHTHCLVDKDAFSSFPCFREEDLKGAFDFEKTEEGLRAGQAVLLPDFLVDGPPDYRLDECSPAIDTGSSAAIADPDLRGNPRVCGAAVDLGAFEYTKSCVKLSIPPIELCGEQTVEVFVHLSTWFPVQGFSVGVAHDPEVVRLAGVDRVGCEMWAGHPAPDGFEADLSAGTGRCGSEGVAGATIRCMASWEGLQSLPGTEDGDPQSIFRLVYEFLPGCTKGSVSPLRLAGCLDDAIGAVDVRVMIEGHWLDPLIEHGEIRCCPNDDVEFRRGDVNDDAAVNLSDAVSLLDYLFRAGEPPGCLEAANPNDDGQVDLTDAVYLLNHLFLQGPAPVSPGYALCGPDPEATGSELGCRAYRTCREHAGVLAVENR